MTNKSVNMTSSTGRVIAAAAVKYNILGLISAEPELSRPESATTRKLRLLYSPCFIRRPHERAVLLIYLGLTEHRRIHGLPEFQQSNTELIGPSSTTTSPFWTPGLDPFLPPLGSPFTVFISLGGGLLLGHFERNPTSLGMNDETLALREQITEIETYQNAQRGQNAHALYLDHEAAILVFENELRMRLMDPNQRSLAQDIPHAAHNNGSNSTEAERNTHTGWGTGFLSIVRTIRNLSASIAQIKPEADTQCCVCFDYYRRSKITRLKCSHLYCTGCLKGLFVRATSDLSLFPPKCCRQDIPLCFIKSELSSGERRKFKRAEVEFTTECKTYCSNSNCREFIPPSSIISDRATCRACRSVTCTMCQNPAHGGDCPDDQALQATLSLAGSRGWKRCYRCRSMVELSTGCNHIT